MPTTIEFLPFAQSSPRLYRSWHKRTGATLDLVLLVLWAIIMLWIAVAAPAGASAEDSAIQSLVGGI